MTHSVEPPEGASEPRVRRRHRVWLAAGVAALLAATAGGVLVGLSVSEQHRHEAAIAAQAARKARVDRRAAAEARAARDHQKAREGTGRSRAATGRSRTVTGRSRASRAGGARPGRAGKAVGHPAGSTPTVGRAGPVSSIGAQGATLVVPALGVRAPIVAEGAVNGSMEIPSDIREVGWYDGIDGGGAATTAAHPAPWPGQPGVAVLAGHVDWAGEGPGALYYLGQLQVGDPLEVIGSNGAVSRWQVSQAPVTISKEALPKDLFVNTGSPKLAIVTCGGPFDSATGHYLDNVIVWASRA